MSDEDRVDELRRLWAIPKVSLPDEAFTYGIAKEVEAESREKGEYEEAKVRRVCCPAKRTREDRRRGGVDVFCNRAD